ncbi:hypothetical protein [Nocardia sp. NPDC047648]|uniref:hypothetical protein n=1 Tax=Nocardia sp. NPDC047648 TaxID=3155625 RepID=UPI0033D5C4A3
MSRGVGKRQIAVLRAILRLERFTSLSEYVLYDLVTEAFWVRAAAVGAESANLVGLSREHSGYRPHLSSVRRSIRSLQDRGLVECHMGLVPVSQRDPEYLTFHTVVRDGLMTRLTPAGRAFLDELETQRINHLKQQYATQPLATEDTFATWKPQYHVEGRPVTDPDAWYAIGRGRSAQPEPRACPSGHLLEPKLVSVGAVTCSEFPDGHRTHTCLVCEVTIFTPPGIGECSHPLATYTPTA